MSQCTARSKRTGQRCQQNAMVGRHLCYHHGGKTPVGPAAPNYIDGRRSKYLPKRLLDDYMRSLNDPDKLAMTEELAVIDARMNDILKRVDSGESSRLWTELRQTYTALHAAQRARDADGLREAMLTLGDLITRGHADWAAWADVTNLIERRRKLVESERKRLVEAQQVVAVDQAMSLMALLIESVKRNVTDERALRAVTDDFVRLTAADGDDRALAPGARPHPRRSVARDATGKPDAA